MVHLARLAKLTILLYICIVKAKQLNMKYNELERIIKGLGWYKIRSVGAHDIYAHDSIEGIIAFPRHGAKEVPKGTEKAILKQARGEQ